MKRIIIKIAHQKQADKPIYLLPNGAIQCGRFKYAGRYKREFKVLYEKILSLVRDKPKDGVLDVSQFQYWDAYLIYHEYMVAKWLKSVSARKMERFAIETEVTVMLKPMSTEFKRAVALKWRRDFKNADLSDPNVPRKGWQIL